LNMIQLRPIGDREDGEIPQPYAGQVRRSSN
jgi:hypothetical protein